MKNLKKNSKNPTKKIQTQNQKNYLKNPNNSKIVKNGQKKPENCVRL